MRLTILSLVAATAAATATSDRNFRPGITSKSLAPNIRRGAISSSDKCASNITVDSNWAVGAWFELKNETRMNSIFMKFVIPELQASPYAIGNSTFNVFQQLVYDDIYTNIYILCTVPQLGDVSCNTAFSPPLPGDSDQEDRNVDFNVAAGDAIYFHVTRQSNGTVDYTLENFSTGQISTLQENVITSSMTGVQFGMWITDMMFPSPTNTLAKFESFQFTDITIGVENGGPSSLPQPEPKFQAMSDNNMTATATRKFDGLSTIDINYVC